MGGWINGWMKRTADSKVILGEKKKKSKGKIPGAGVGGVAKGKTKRKKKRRGRTGKVGNEEEKDKKK